MEYSPPPLFKQGAPARVKVLCFSVFAILLLFADARMHVLGVVRQVVGVALYPLQVLVLLPRDGVVAAGDYVTSVSTLRNELTALQAQQVKDAQTVQQVTQLLGENAQLRNLLGAGERVSSKFVAGQILYDARDPYSRKVIVDRGTHHGVALGQPVIDERGVIGQITRVTQFTSEVSLLTDKDQAIPTMVVRNGLRAVAYGRGHINLLELRFVAANSDIKKGDTIVTSGIDGVYPAGLAVAEVLKVEHHANEIFDSVFCKPLSGMNHNKHVLVLLVDTHLKKEELLLPVAPQSNKASVRARVAGKQ